MDLTYSIIRARMWSYTQIIEKMTTERVDSVGVLPYYLYRQNHHGMCIDEYFSKNKSGLMETLGADVSVLNVVGRSWLYVNYLWPDMRNRKPFDHREFIRRCNKYICLDFVEYAKAGVPFVIEDQLHADLAISNYWYFHDRLASFAKTDPTYDYMSYLQTLFELIRAKISFIQTPRWLWDKLFYVVALYGSTLSNEKEDYVRVILGETLWQRTARFVISLDEWINTHSK